MGVGLTLVLKDPSPVPWSQKVSGDLTKLTRRSSTPGVETFIRKIFSSTKGVVYVGLEIKVRETGRGLLVLVVKVRDERMCEGLRRRQTHTTGGVDLYLPPNRVRDLPLSSDLR